MKNEVEHKSYHYWNFAGQITAQLNQTYLPLGGAMLVAVAIAVCIFLLSRQVQHPPISHEPPPPRVHFLSATEMPAEQYNQLKQPNDLTQPLQSGKRNPARLSNEE